MQRTMLKSKIHRATVSDCDLHYVGSITIDEGGGEHQTFVEDCSECCKPRVVHFESSPDVKRPRVWLERGDGL